jgi:hypothetical protein
MKLALSVELEDLWFGMKQIIDLKSLTDDQYYQVQINNDDITGNLKKNLVSALEFGGVIH